MGEALGEELNDEVRQTLFEQTQGNPALLLECIRLFRELKISTKKHFSKDWLKQVVDLHSFEDLLLKG